MIKSVGHSNITTTKLNEHKGEMENKGVKRTFL